MKHTPPFLSGNPFVLEALLVHYSNIPVHQVDGADLPRAVVRVPITPGRHLEIERHRQSFY